MIYYGGHPVVGFADAGCPNNPPPPADYVIWRGAVPAELTQWALMLVRNLAAPPYGRTWTMRWNDTIVVARKDHHSWTFRKNPDGTTTLVTGICVPGVTLYRPR